MKLKFLSFSIAIIIIAFTGCSNTNNNKISPSTTNVNTSTISSTQAKQTVAPTQAEQTTTPKTTVNYSIYTGNWICKDKKTSIDIKIDSSGNVKGSITTVVGSHVPSSLIIGTIKNDILVAKLDDEGGPYTGTITLYYTDPKIFKGNVKLDNADSVSWKLAEGELQFERYSEDSN